MAKDLNLTIYGMTCDTCAGHVKKALNSIQGVIEVDLPGWQDSWAKVKVIESVDPTDLERVVYQAGYKAIIRPLQPSNQESNQVTGNEKKDFDLMVVGGGSAGFAAAIKAAELGYRVALVESGIIGGTCVNVGCVPSKTLIRAMEQAHNATSHSFRGVRTKVDGLNWAEIIAQKDELVTDLRKRKYQDVLAGYSNISYIQGRARLVDSKKIQINGRLYNPGKIILTTGASPWIPPIPGLAESGFLTSTTAMELKELPQSMIVLGANAVGLELAQVFSRAGVKVTVLELLPRIAPFEDEEISAELHSNLEEEGLQLITGFQTNRVVNKDLGYVLHGQQGDRELSFEADQLLVAAGRRANTKGLGLEEAGVEIGERGEILVDEILRTSNPYIFAAGDVIGREMFVYVAAYAGGLAAENALLDSGRRYDTVHVPRITFTDPQIASAGITETQAKEHGYEIKTSVLTMDYVPRALAAHDTRGLIKLVVNTRNDRLLGAHILAPEAGEMIQVAVLALRFGLSVTDLRETLFPYLTNTEGIKLAMIAMEKDVSLLSCCAG